jgi:hypothetical protein
MKLVPVRFLTQYWPALALLAGLLPATASAQGLETVQRVMHSRSWGDRTYTCLAIDGGVVPLVVPPGKGTRVQAGGGVTITWPNDDGIAHIRTASKQEAALADLMGKPEAAEAWKKYIASTLRGPGYKFQIDDFQPDMLDVNEWRIGAVSMEFTLAGRSSSSLVMIWRCKDGSTLAVTLLAGLDAFKAHAAEIDSMIGSSLLLPP